MEPKSMAAKQQKTAKKTPETVDRLRGNQKWVYTDSNGYDWEYEFQFPGIRKAYEIIDNARMENGQIARSVMYDEMLKSVVVQPHGLTLDDFDNRPGAAELFDAVDSFLGSRMQ